MLKKVLSALVGSQRTSFREYAEIESHHCQVAPRIAGMSSLSPCGRYLVAVMNDRIMIFDRRSGTSRPIVLNDSQQSGMALNVTEFSSLSTTGGYVYIGTVHRLVYEVELSTGATKKFTHPDLGLVAHMSVVGRQMLTCSVDTVWRFWDLRDGDGILKPRRSQTVPDNQIILALALSPVDSTRGLVSSGADCLYVDFTSGETLLRLKGHADAVRTCVIQDSLALTGSFDMSVLVRFIAVLARQRDDEATNHVYEKGVALSSDGLKAVTCSLDKTVKIWDFCNTEARELLELADFPEAIRYLSLSSSGRYLTTGAEDGAISLFDLNYGDAHRMLALCAGGHSRLGKKSYTNRLPSDVLKRISKFLMYLI